MVFQKKIKPFRNKRYHGCNEGFYKVIIRGGVLKDVLGL